MNGHHVDVCGIIRRHSEYLRCSWQGQLLANATGKLGVCVMSMLAHSFEAVMPQLMEACFPGHEGIPLPMLRSCAKITQRGRIIANLIDKDLVTHIGFELFQSEADMEGEFRKLADRLRFTDAERVAMFDAVRRWIVADFRIDPLTGEKEKVA
jgi:hypothetical protein